MTTLFTSTIIEYAKKFIPNKTVTISDKDALWITPPVKQAIKRNKKAYKNWVKRGRISYEKPNVNTIQNETNKIIQDSKEMYIKRHSEKLCDPNSGPKIFWSSYKKLLNNKKNTNIPPISVEGTFISNFKEKAKIFNKYFAEQCQPLENSSVLPGHIDYQTDNRIGTVKIDINDIVEVIKKLNPKKAHGVDDISIAILKMCPQEIAIPLKMIFEKAIDTGNYPQLWKEANVQPIHKKNSRQLVENYRPISLLCISGKIFEKLIFDSMYTFLNSNSLISKNQSGFRPGDSAINQLLSITTEIYEAFENYDEVRAVFLDISKAFDKVWHRGLIHKLKKCGINEKLIVLLENYLTNRIQRVVLNGQASDWEKINSGVPQGSVLGPLLFLIYINDLTDGISSNMKLFADDSSLFSRVQNISATHDQLVSDLNKITDWAFQWKMKFNPDITKQAIEVIFSSKYKKESHPPLNFNDIPVARKSSTKHLGVILDERLSFREHVKEAIEKAKKGLALMRFLAKYVSSSILEKTYFMYVRPHLDYGDVIYHDQNKDMMNLLESLQYRAGLIITNCWKGTNKLKLYEELGWESLSQRRTSRRLTLYYKILNDYTPPYLKSHIKPFVGNMTNRLRNSFFPFCASKWESINADMKNSGSVPEFKSKYKKEYAPQKRGYFSINDKYGIRLLTKLRVGLSDLREHRFRHNFKNCSPICKCEIGDESTEHFLARCPLYTNLRNNLLENISAIVGYNIKNLQAPHLVDLLLYGSDTLNVVKNKQILEHTIEYITRSKRFAKLEAFLTNREFGSLFNKQGIVYTHIP